MIFDRDKTDLLEGRTVKINTPCGKCYITVNWYEGRPVEIFAHAGKTGACVASNVNAICRVVSIALQYGVPIERLIKQLIGNQCERAAVGIEAISCADAIGKVMQKELERKSLK